jgi:hypothetical protein
MLSMVPGSRSMKCAFEWSENQGFVCNLAAIPLFGLGPKRILLGQRIHLVEEAENRYKIIIGHMIHSHGRHNPPRPDYRHYERNIGEQEPL